LHHSDDSASRDVLMTHPSRAIFVAILLAGGVVIAPLGAQTNSIVAAVARAGGTGRGGGGGGGGGGGASDSSTDESRERPPAFATGVTAGAMSFAGGRSEQGVAVMLQYAATPWLTFSAAPGF